MDDEDDASLSAGAVIRDVGFLSLKRSRREVHLFLDSVEGHWRGRGQRVLITDRLQIVFVKSSRSEEGLQLLEKLQPTSKVKW